MVLRRLRLRRGHHRHPAIAGLASGNPTPFNSGPATIASHRAAPERVVAPARRFAAACGPANAIHSLDAARCAPRWRWKEVISSWAPSLPKDCNEQRTTTSRRSEESEYPVEEVGTLLERTPMGHG